MKEMAIVLFSFFSLYTYAEPELKVGIGFVTHEILGLTVPAISIKEKFNEDYSASAAVGLNTQNEINSYIVGASLFRNAMQKKYSNLFMNLGLYFLSVGKDSSSGFKAEIAIGSEFFFQHLETIGFSVSMGFGLMSLKGQVAFKTIANSFANGGVHIYF